MIQIPAINQTKEEEYEGDAQIAHKKAQDHRAYGGADRSIYESPEMKGMAVIGTISHITTTDAQVF